MKTFYFFFLLFLLAQCAQIVPPSGGEKDITAPKIKNSKPENANRFFDSKKISIVFDEFFSLKSSPENIIISPALTNNPRFEIVGKKLNIYFNESLKENTTYLIQFNEAIADINEGNILSNFTYVFSTGTTIDSLQLKGKVIDAYSKEAAKDIYVMLFPQGTDSLLTVKPLYFTKTDDNGYYVLDYLKAGTYQIAALEDKNQNLIFDQVSEKTAFYNNEVTIADTINVLEPMYIFQEIKELRRIEENNKENNHYIFKFNAPFSQLALDVSTYDSADVVYYSKNKQELHYWYTNKNEETQFLFTINNQKQDTLISILKQNEEYTAFECAIESKQNDTYKLIQIRFPFPINNFNQSKLIIEDSKKLPIDYTYTWDNNAMELTLQFTSNADTIFYTSKDSCFQSFHKLYSKALIETIKSFNKNISNLSLKLDYNEQNNVFQLLNAKKEIVFEKNVSRETIVNIKNLKPEKYYIRIYEDSNNNGIWDSGMFHVKQLSEKTLFFSPEIELKPNWDKELEIKF